MILDVVGPALERDAHFVLERADLIRADDAGEMPAVVSKCALDYLVRTPRRCRLQATDLLMS